MNQNFLACDGEWQANAGNPVCVGILKTVTRQELAQSLQQDTGLTYDEMKPLIESAIGLFSIVFVILVIKKALF